MGLGATLLLNFVSVTALTLLTCSKITRVVKIYAPVIVPTPIISETTPQGLV